MRLHMISRILKIDLTYDINEHITHDTALLYVTRHFIINGLNQ